MICSCWGELGSRNSLYISRSLLWPKAQDAPTPRLQNIQLFAEQIFDLHPGDQNCCMVRP